MDIDMFARVSAVEARQERHGVILETLTRDVELLRHGMATRDVVEASIAALAGQLASTERILKVQLTNQKNDLNDKISDIREQVEPIRKGINRIVWLIITALIGVLLTMAFAGLPFAQHAKVP